MGSPPANPLLSLPLLLLLLPWPASGVWVAEEVGIMRSHHPYIRHWELGCDEGMGVRGKKYSADTSVALHHPRLHRGCWREASPRRTHLRAATSPGSASRPPGQHEMQPSVRSLIQHTGRPPENRTPDGPASDHLGTGEPYPGWTRRPTTGGPYPGWTRCSDHRHLGDRMEG